MKFQIILFFTALICSTYGQTTRSPGSHLKTELLKRADLLDVVIKNEIKVLQNQKKEHMSQVLTEEEKRLETLVNELKAVKETDEVKLAVIESQLIEQEYRVVDEVNHLQREAQTQELLVNNAQVLVRWINEQVKIMEAVQDDRKARAQEVIAQLKKEETRLNEIVQELLKAQVQKDIEKFEVELRAIETRLYIVISILKRLEKTTKAPVTGTTRAGVTTPGPATTLSMLQIKDLLLKRAAQLEKGVTGELAKLNQENRTAQAVPLQKLELELKDLLTKINKYNDTDILYILNSELYFIETRLAIELQALVAQDQRLTKLTAIANALKQRIASAVKVLGTSRVGKALAAEATKLDTVLAELKNAKVEKTFDNLELQLALIEKKVTEELNSIGQTTTPKPSTPKF